MKETIYNTKRYKKLPKKKKKKSKIIKSPHLSTIPIHVEDTLIKTIDQQELKEINDRITREYSSNIKTKCWFWRITHDHHKYGYGMIYDNGIVYVSVLQILAYEQLKSRVNIRENVCGNPYCVNPRHYMKE